MSQLSNPGRYFAIPEAWAIKAKAEKSPQFAITFRVTSLADGTPVDGEKRIVGWFTLINNNGSANEININALKESLGWDGQSFSTLESSDWSGVEVQIVVDEKDYNGKKSLEVKYLNPKEYSGGSRLAKADPQAVQSLDSKYGSLLRAISKKDGASKPANRPAALLDPVAASKQSAWDAFVVKAPTQDTARRVEIFKQILGDVFPGKETKDLSADDWKSVKTEIETNFSNATGSLIPF